MPLRRSGLNHFIRKDYMEFTGLYIYVDGSDVEDIAEPLISDILEWKTQYKLSVSIINDKFEKTPDMIPEDLPDWHLGLNINKTALSIGLLTTVVSHLSDLAIKYKRDFVIGYYDKNSEASEDILFFGYESPKNNIVDIVKDFLDIS